MTQKQKNLNLRLSESEREELEKRSFEAGLKLSEYVRRELFSVKQSISNEEQSNTGEKDMNNKVLLLQLKSKDDQIQNLTRLLENQQTLLLNAQTENQKLLEYKSKSWWQFWK